MENLREISNSKRIETRIKSGVDIASKYATCPFVRGRKSSRWFYGCSNLILRKILQTNQPCEWDHRSSFFFFSLFPTFKLQNPRDSNVSETRNNGGRSMFFEAKRFCDGDSTRWTKIYLYPTKTRRRKAVTIKSYN